MGQIPRSIERISSNSYRFPSFPRSNFYFCIVFISQIVIILVFVLAERMQ